MALLPPLEILESQLNGHVLLFEDWLNENYTSAAIKADEVDSPAYPGWNGIGDTVESLFKYDVRQLSVAATTDLIFLIGHNWDLGWILNWLSESSYSFSNLGKLTAEEFYHLCEHALRVADAPVLSQCASLFKRFDSLTPVREKLLLALFNSGDSYTRRQALSSLAQLGYRQTEALVELAWNDAEDDEDEKLTCLRALQRVQSPLLEAYWQKALADSREPIVRYLAAGK